MVYIFKPLSASDKGLFNFFSYYCTMVNSLNHILVDRFGQEYEISITAIHTDPKGYGFKGVKDYEITAWDDQDTDDEDYKPVLLGYFHFSDGLKDWVYDGGRLTIQQQEDIAEIIQNYKD